MFMLRITPSSAAIDATPAERPETKRAVIERQLSMLTRLAEIGMEIAEEAGRAAAQGARGAQAGALPDPALAYSRAARAVRLTIALQSRLMDDLESLDEAEAKAAAQHVAARRQRVQRLVERTIKGERDGAPGVGRLWAHASERLTEVDDADIAGLPLEQIVVCICEQLELSAEWTAWAVSQVADDSPGAARSDPAGADPPGSDPFGADAAPTIGPLDRPPLSPSVNLTG